jgi:tyrosine decarboxylase / aspartate 1-decarboxylase
VKLKTKYGFRLHVDAAYGGYFKLADNLASPAKTAFDHIAEADSIVIDPHKHGLQPYGCGCVLFRDPAVGQLYKHDSPYTYFSSKDLHLGEISLECSRAGASAVALWATQRMLPLQRGGEFARGLNDSRDAALEFHKMLRADERFITSFSPELDIVIWIPKAERASSASVLSQTIFTEAAKRNLHLALATLPTKFFAASANQARMELDKETITCLRSVLMKPEHKQWIARIYGILDEVTSQLLAR